MKNKSINSYSNSGKRETNINKAYTVQDSTQKTLLISQKKTEVSWTAGNPVRISAKPYGKTMEKTGKWLKSNRNHNMIDINRRKTSDSNVISSI